MSRQYCLLPSGWSCLFYLCHHMCVYPSDASTSYTEPCPEKAIIAYSAYSIFIFPSRVARLDSDRKTIFYHRACTPQGLQSVCWRKERSTWQSRMEVVPKVLFSLQSDQFLLTWIGSIKQMIGTHTHTHTDTVSRTESKQQESWTVTNEPPAKGKMKPSLVNVVDSLPYRSTSVFVSLCQTVE